jgi:hypothetical protein
VGAAVGVPVGTAVGVAVGTAAEAEHLHIHPAWCCGVHADPSAPLSFTNVMICPTALPATKLMQPLGNIDAYGDICAFVDSRKIWPVAGRPLASLAAAHSATVKMVAHPAASSQVPLVMCG